MKISVALTTYNGEKYLRQQLESLLAQTRLPDEIVVSDDCSTDGTLQVVEDFRGACPVPVLVCVNPGNLGHLRNFERALSMCTGELVFLSDQDDRWYPAKIATILAQALAQPDRDVFINDAAYTDEHLVASNATVMERVRAVGGDSNGHIAGACTAVTRRFLRFLLPFPAQACPQHDVYIHRWANLVGNKVTVPQVLQVWRIHGASATHSNEMHSPVTANLLARFSRGRGADAVAAYEKKAREYAVMQAVLEQRTGAYSALPAAAPANEVARKISTVIAANLARARVARAGRLSRVPLVAAMLVRGQYSHFKGFRSVAMDLLR